MKSATSLGHHRGISAKARFPIFVLASLLATAAFEYIAGHYVPVASLALLVAAVVLCAAVAWTIGIWGPGSGTALKIAAFAVCIMAPAVSLLLLILAICYIGPECM